MRIGLVIGLHEQPSGTPRWEDIKAQVLAAEQVGFDIAVFGDALSLAGRGHWESIAMVGAVAAATKTIELSHSVVGAPLRSPAIIAEAAETLDEISGGRYTLGIGAGNTPDDFAAYSLPVDRKFSRLEETLSIIASLLRQGSVDFDGEFHSAHRGKLSPRGSRPQGPPIVVAGAGPRVLRMCAQFGDGWNWWGDAADPTKGVVELITELERACVELGRDPVSVQRTFDLYAYDVLGVTGSKSSEWALVAKPPAIAESILSLAELGINEVRCDVVAEQDQRVAAAEAMAPVVELVHAG